MTTELGSQPASSGDMPFWEWMVGSGKIEGDANYYASGDAKQEPGAYSHAIQVGFNATAPGSPERREYVDRLYSEGIISGADREYWYSGTEESLGEDWTNLGTAAETKFNPQAAGPAEPTGVMGGGTLIKINREGADPLWGMRYVVDGIEHIYTFVSEDAMKAALGENAGLGQIPTMTEDQVNDGDTWIIGDAASLTADATTSYATWWENIKREAGLEAGIRQPGKRGEYLSDPEVMRIIAEGEAGDWSKERIQAEIRGTDYYQNTLYPGIAGIMAHNASDPEGEWMQYMNSVTPYLAQLGMRRMLTVRTGI